MNPIRVLIVDMPPLMTDIANEIIARQPDMELIASVAIGGDLRGALDRTCAQVLLCTIGGSALPTIYRELFESHPHLRLLAIEDGDRHGSVYELRPRRTPLDVWPAGLVEAIRSAARPPQRFSWDPPAADQR